MTVKDEKYIVFKRADYDRVLLTFAAGRGELAMLGEIEVPDAVVMRRQDVFSPPALDAYANGIQVALTICKAVGVEAPEGLQEKADYFHEQSAEAWLTERKIPD